MKQPWVFLLFFGLCSLWLAGAVSAAPEAAPGVAEADPRRQLQAILEQPIYHRWALRQERKAVAPTSPNESWLAGYIEDWFESAGELIGDFFKWLLGDSNQKRISSFSGGAVAVLSFLKILAWFVLGGVILFLAVVLYRVLTRGGSASRGGRVLSRAVVQEAMEKGEALTMAGPEWFGQAKRLMEEGDLRAVYRALYLGLLSGLHSEDKIDFRPNRTNWTYVTHYRGPEGERHRFDHLTTLFDDVWYGLKPASHDDIGSIRTEAASLIGVVDHEG